jgi:hypothetical protein
MKKISLILVIAALFISCNNDAQNTNNNNLKRYKVKSGIIIYNIATSGKVMGSVISGSGTEKLYFKDWGAIELLEEESITTTKMKMFGQKSTETENVHTISKLDNGESYHVDFKKKEIYAGRDMAMDMVKMFHPTSDAGETGKSMTDGMGGKVIGNETFLGYDCEIYDLMGSKQWIYKGVTLKMEVTVMGITTIKTATSAKFDVSISNSYFELPDFPIVKMEGYQTNEEFDSDMEDMDENIDALKNMSFEEWKKIATENDEEMQNMSDEELRETYNMLQKMLQMRN